MSYSVEWVFPVDCEFCRSPLRGADIVTVMSPTHVDFYCATCSKVNHVSKSKKAEADKAKGVSRGAVDHAQ